MIIKNNFLKLATISTLIILFITTNIFAANIDLSAGKIVGKNGDYYFKIPVSWDNYVYATRDKTDLTDYFDKIDFYYKHKDVGNNDVKFLSLYVYYKENYSSRGYANQTKILSTDKYIFTTTSYMDNPYSSVNDRIIFSRFLIELGTPNFISNKIYVSANKPNISQSGTVTVNNSTLNVKPIISNNEIYLPLRDIVEKLGYTVKWTAKTKEINLKKGNKSVTIPTNSTKLINKQGTIYMPISFFMQKLNCSIDVDARNNIKLKG